MEYSIILKIISTRTVWKDCLIDNLFKILIKNFNIKIQVNKIHLSMIKYPPIQIDKMKISEINFNLSICKKISKNANLDNF
jgi:hypothetical protein